MADEEKTRREELQDLLEETLGTENVYFQPPASFKMTYPCIVYELKDIKTLFASGTPYLLGKQYQVTSIDRDPDSETVDKLSLLPMCIFDRHFVSDGLNHNVFVMYF
jgi:hypothetical protein